MNDWKVIISVYHDGYKRALRPCRDRIALAALSEPAAGLNPYATWRSCFDRDLRDAELAYRPSVRQEMAGGPCDSEGGITRCERQRQQQLIGKVKFDCRGRGMMLEEGGNRRVGNGLRWLSGPTESREACR